MQNNVDVKILSLKKIFTKRLKARSNGADCREKQMGASNYPQR